MQEIVRTAIHEAGHAVAHWLLGAPVRSVAIIPDRLFSGQILLFAHDRPVGALQYPEVRAEAVGLMGGAAAEALATGSYEPKGSSSDLDALAALLADEDDLQSAIHEVLEEATALLARNWAAVSALAGLLLEKKTIDGDVVAQVLRAQTGIRLGEEPDAPDRYDIWSATITGNLAALRRLLAEGADPNARNELGMTPLHEAASRGMDEVVRLLLDWGADPAIEDAGHKTPLAWATMKNRSSTAALLATHRHGRGGTHGGTELMAECVLLQESPDRAEPENDDSATELATVRPSEGVGEHGHQAAIADALSDVWYYRVGARVFGPVGWAEIERLTTNRTVAQNLLVSRDRQDGWQRAADVRRDLALTAGGSGACRPASSRAPTSGETLRAWPKVLAEDEEGRPIMQQTVSAQEFVLVNATGSPRAWLGLVNDQPSLALFDGAGNSRAGLEFTNGEPGLWLRDAGGRIRAWLRLAGDEPSLDLRDRTGRVRASLGILHGDPDLALYAPGQMIPAAQLLVRDDAPGLALIADDGDTQVWLALSERGTACSVSARGGRVELELTDDGPKISVYDETGQTRWQAP